jgi:ParB family chromosome partitioning protein
MSVADKLGTGSSFSKAPRGRSARGRAKDVTQGDVPAYELVRLRRDEVSPTPLNPRRNFGSDEVRKALSYFRPRACHPQVKRGG